MEGKIRRLFRALPVILSLAWLQAAEAQFDPRQVLAGVIHQAQTGTPNPSWYGADLWQIIAVQTGNTGFYPALAQLGSVNNIAILEQQQLPLGRLYAMTATHQKGKSNWVIGISSLTNRIEYAAFTIGQATETTPLPQPEPAGRRASEPKPGPQSEACKKFPNLCP